MWITRFMLPLVPEIYKLQYMTHNSQLKLLSTKCVSATQGLYEGDNRTINPKHYKGMAPIEDKGNKQDV